MSNENALKLKRTAMMPISGSPQINTPAPSAGKQVATTLLSVF
jgi:hypothetical protein